MPRTGAGTSHLPSDGPRRDGGDARAIPGRIGPQDIILAEFPRDGSEGEPAALRVYLSEFNGRPLLHARTWIKGRSGEWFPTKGGFTIRLGEIDAIISALGKAKAAMMNDAAERSGNQGHNDLARPGTAPSAPPTRPPADSGPRDVPPWEG